MKEDSVVYLCSLVAMGIIFIGATVTYFQSNMGIPIIILGIFSTALILVTNRGHFAHRIENLEKVFFFITFFVLCILFIVHFRPF